MSSLSKVKDYDAHVVTPFAIRSRHIRREQCVHETFANFGDLYLPLHLNVNVVDDLLVCFCLPDSVAAHYYEVELV